MPAKTPIYLKSTNSKKGKKCRLRDMSFLQGNFELLPGKERPPLQYVGHSEFLRANSASEASFTETPSPVLKNAISLPTIGGSQALTLPLISATPFPPSPEPFDITGTPAPSPPGGTEVPGPPRTHALLLSLDVLRPNHSRPMEPEEKPSFLLHAPARPSGPPHAVHGENGYRGGSGTAHIGENGYDTPPPCYSNGNGAVRHVTKHPGYYEGWLDCEETRICDFEFELSDGRSASQDSISKVTGSLLSLELDLGPSILDDVLNIMDRP